jgi:hypothetical protein
MAYKGFKVSAVEVSKNDLAYINNKLSQYGMVPNTVIAGWHRNAELSKWQNELLDQGQNSATLPYDDDKVGANVKRAVSEYLAFRAAKPGKKQRGRD